MGFFGKSLAEIIFGAVTGSKSSTSSSFSLNDMIKTTITPTVPTVNPFLTPKPDTPLDTFKKLDTILMDVDTEGEKRGYERAAAEYDAAYERVENEYLTAKKLLDQQMADKDAEFSRLISKLQELEEDVKNLKREIREKTTQVSEKYDVSTSTVSQALDSGMLLMGGSGIFDLIYRYKSKKLKEAEEKGYAEAKRLYKNKIKELRNNLELLKKKGNAEMQKMAKLITDTIKELSDAETKIAELEIALNS